MYKMLQQPHTSKAIAIAVSYYNTNAIGYWLGCAADKGAGKIGVQLVLSGNRWQGPKFAATIAASKGNRTGSNKGARGDGRGKAKGRGEGIKG